MVIEVLLLQFDRFIFSTSEFPLISK